MNPTPAPLRRYPQHFQMLPEPGPPDLDLAVWSERCCGLACLRTVLHSHDLQVPTQTTLLRRAITAEAFTAAGIVHGALADIASAFGLRARAVAVPNVKLLFQLGDLGYPSITSITHTLPVDGRRGGHMVVTDGTVGDTDGVRFVDPSRWGRDHHRVSLSRFRASYTGRAIVCWPPDDPRGAGLVEQALAASR